MAAGLSVQNKCMADLLAKEGKTECKGGYYISGVNSRLTAIKNAPNAAAATSSTYILFTSV